FPCSRLFLWTAVGRATPIPTLPLFGSRPLDLHTRSLLGRLRRAAALRASVGCSDLARLQHLLEVAQVVADLLAGLLTEELGDRCAECAARRVVAHLDVGLSTAPAGSGDEAHRARVAHGRAVERAPGD